MCGQALPRSQAGHAVPRRVVAEIEIERKV